MLEPTSSAGAAATAMGAVAITSVLPGVNGDALIGAFAGAVVFALHAKNLSVLKRLIYMLISLVIGYFGSPELMHRFGLHSYTIAAFGLSAVVVTIALASIDRIRNFDVTSLFRR